LPQLGAVLQETAGIRRAGAAALDLAWVARGRLDGFWEMDLKPWDIAAGVLLVREAGGTVTELFGRSEVMDTGNVLAGNLRIHAALARRIEALRDSPAALHADPEQS
ncbi:MAG: inositol monophosphatase family protein, partial [Algiphilus sp.]